MPLAEQVQYLEGQIVSKTLAQNRHHSMTLFAFDKGEEISSHDSEGDTIVMPANIPHAVFATGQFKMLLTVLFPENR